MTDKNLLEKSIEETVDEMKQKIDEITKEAECCEPKVKTVVKEVADKAITILSASVDKLKEFAKNAKDSDEVKKTVSFIKEKTSDITTTTLAKIKEIKNSEEVQKGLKDVSSKVKQGAEFTMDKLSEGYQKAKDKINEELEKNEDLKKVVDNTIDTAKKGIDAVSQKVNDFMSKPDVAEKLDQAKDKTIDLAEKALDGLKNWLGKDDHKG